MTYADGSVYVGKWKNDKRDGTGKFQWKQEGAYYEGEFRNDQITGRGVMEWP